MFGFLFRLFRRKKGIERLADDWVSEQTPRSAEAYARCLLERGDATQALEVLREAYRLFPQAPRIRTCYHHAMRLKSSEEIRSLRQAIAAEGRPEVYARLAELYRYLGHFQEALEVANAGLQRYPAYSGNYLAVGRVHYTRFLKSSSARDGRQAVQYLRRACELDGQNFKTLFHLANLYLTVGDRKNAHAYIERLSTLVPGDQRIHDLRRRCDRLPVRVVADFFTRYETSRIDPDAGGTFGGTSSVEIPETANAGLAKLRQIRGVSAATLLNGGGAVLLSDVDESWDDKMQERAASVAHRIFEGARANAPRMSVGTFGRGVLNSDHWRIFFYDHAGTGLAVFADANVREDFMHRKVESFFTTHLSTTQVAE